MREKLKIESQNSNLTNKSGQIVLILVLITVVGLTIGLSLISRTISDIRISSQIEQSNRAFSAAEAGIENALKGSTVAEPTGTVSFGDASANYTVTTIGGGSEPIAFSFTESGASQNIWLINHDTNGNISAGSYGVGNTLTVCFGSVANSHPAIVVTLLYFDPGDSLYKIAKGAYDSSSRSNGFASIDSDSPGACAASSNQYKVVINPEDDLGIPAGATLYTMRIQLVYEGSALTILPQAGQSLPNQGKLITSVGQTETGVVRRIQVIQGYTTLPSLLDFALFTEQ